MTLLSLPKSPADLAEATWPEIAKYYDELAAAAPTADTAREWLRQWSLLEELVNEASSLALMAYTGNTADSKAEAQYLRFVTEIQPNVEARQTGLARLLLACWLDQVEI